MLTLLLLLLLMMTMELATLTSAVTISDICNPGNRCNFTWLDAQLNRTLRTESGRLPDAALASALVALNLRLRQQLAEAADCAKRWLRRPPDRDCRFDACCPEATLGGLVPALDRLKADAKLSFTRISAAKLVVAAAAANNGSVVVEAAYYSGAFDILNVFSSAFMDFVRQLAVDSRQAQLELDTFAVFYARIRREGAVQAVESACWNQTSSALSDAASAAEGTAIRRVCARRGHQWMNAISVALQNLVMCEVASLGADDVEAAWQTYLGVAECVTRSAMACEKAGATGADADGNNGGGASAVATGGLGSSDIALIVLIPTLVVLLAVAVGVATRASRRRRRMRQRLEEQRRLDRQQQQQQLQEEQANKDQQEGAEDKDPQDRRHGKPDGEPSESFPMIDERAFDNETLHLRDPEVV